MNDLEEDRQAFMRGELSADAYIQRRRSYWASKMAENNKRKNKEK